MKRETAKTFDIINEQVRSNRGGQVRGWVHSVSIRESDFYRLVTTGTTCLREWERRKPNTERGVKGLDYLGGRFKKL